MLALDDSHLVALLEELHDEVSVQRDCVVEAFDVGWLEVDHLAALVEVNDDPRCLLQLS